MVQDLVSCEQMTRAALICWKMWTRAAQSGSAWETSRLLPAGGLALGYQRSPSAFLLPPKTPLHPLDAPLAPPNRAGSCLRWKGRR